MNRYEIHKTHRLLMKRYYVLLVAENYEPVVVSQMLKSKQACYTNIDAQREAAIGAEVVDRTGES